MNTLRGKIVIKSEIRLMTGLHIGTSGDFAAIGAVDSVVVRDPFTRMPIIPGSSIKGKMRYLLSRVLLNDQQELHEIKEDSTKLKRLFGSSDPVTFSRLKWRDCHLTEISIDELSQLDLDLPFSEIKFENTISRATGIANPRQLERVPAGAIFGFEVVYDVENPEELEEDLENVGKAMKLLELDYLGGHGSRGYGRVEFKNVSVELIKYHDSVIVDENKILEAMKY